MDKELSKVGLMERDLDRLQSTVKDLTKDVVTLKSATESMIRSQSEGNETQRELAASIRDLAKQHADQSSKTGELLIEMMSAKDIGARAHKRVDEQGQDIKLSNARISEIEKLQSKTDGMLGLLKIVWPLLALGVVATSLVTIMKIQGG